MRHNRQTLQTLISCLLLLLLISLVGRGQKLAPSADISAWKTLRNRSGWSIKYPPELIVHSCHSCRDLSDPNVYVSFSQPSDESSLMIEHLINKPAATTLDDWLNELKRTVVPNLNIREEFVVIAGVPALRVLRQTANSGEAEIIYLVRESQTFQITISGSASGSKVRDLQYYPVYQQMLLTLRFVRK